MRTQYNIRPNNKLTEKYIREQKAILFKMQEVILNDRWSRLTSGYEAWQVATPLKDAFFRIFRTVKRERSNYWKLCMVEVFFFLFFFTYLSLIIQFQRTFRYISNAFLI